MQSLCTTSVVSYPVSVCLRFTASWYPSPRGPALLLFCPMSLTALSFSLLRRLFSTVLIQISVSAPSSLLEREACPKPSLPPFTLASSHQILIPLLILLVDCSFHIFSSSDLPLPIAAFSWQLRVFSAFALPTKNTRLCIHISNIPIPPLDNSLWYTPKSLPYPRYAAGTIGGLRYSNPHRHKTPFRHKANPRQVYQTDRPFQMWICPLAILTMTVKGNRPHHWPPILHESQRRKFTKASYNHFIQHGTSDFHT